MVGTEYVRPVDWGKDTCDRRSGQFPTIMVECFNNTPILFFHMELTDNNNKVRFDGPIVTK